MRCPLTTPIIFLMLYTYYCKEVLLVLQYLKSCQCWNIFVLYITCPLHVTYARHIYVPTLHQSKTIKNPTTHRTAHILRLLHCVKVSRQLVFSYWFNLTADITVPDSYHSHDCGDHCSQHHMKEIWNEDRMARNTQSHMYLTMPSPFMRPLTVPLEASWSRTVRASKALKTYLENLAFRKKSLRIQSAQLSNGRTRVQIDPWRKQTINTK